MFAVGVDISGTGAQTEFLRSVSRNSGMYKGKYNWNHIILMSLFVVAMCDLKMVTAVEVTQNCAALEQEVKEQLVLDNAGQQRLAWEGLPYDMEEATYCSKALDDKDYISDENSYEVLQNVTYVFKTSWPAFTVTVLKCIRKINASIVRYLALSSKDNTCAYVFFKSRGTSYNLEKKVCGLPPVVHPPRKPNDDKNKPSSSSSQGS